MDQIKTYFNKLPLCNEFVTAQTPHILIQTQWLDNKIIFNIQEPTINKSFKGELSINLVKESATELEIPYEEFYNDCRQALTTNFGMESFVYELNQENNKFILNKKSSFTIQYLEIELQENNKIASEMLEAAIGIINQQSQLSLATDGINEQLKQSYQDTVDAFERCIEEKNNLENKLLKKFALLLNSKKNKIAELQDILIEKGYNFDEDTNQAQNKEDLQMELGTEPSTSAIAKQRTNSKNKKNKPMTIESDADDDDDYLKPTQEMTPPRNNVDIESD